MKLRQVRASQKGHIKRRTDKIAVIIAGGEIRDYAFARRILRSADIIISANSGYNHAKRMKINPEIIIGDMDSICLANMGPDLNGTELKVYPEEKSSSDTELAIKYSARLGYGKIVVLGAFGKRMDHTLANILSAGLYPGRVVLIDEFTELTVVQKDFTLKGRPGETVSILPFFSRAKILSSSGFKYSLDNLTLMPNSRGLSNVLSRKTAKGAIGKGKLLIVRAKKNG